MVYDKTEEIKHDYTDKKKIVRDTIKGLSSKKPDETLNVFKVKRINLLLEQANALLKDLKPYDDFEIFTEDLLPSNSDALMILELYLEAFKRYWINNSTHGSWDMEREWKITKNKKK